MPSSCCAVGCTHRSSTHPNLKFYSIPSIKHPFHQNRRRLWLQAIRRDNWSEKEIKNARLCSSHFLSGRASLDINSPDFVPTIFTYNMQTEKISGQKQSRYERSVNRRKRDESNSITGKYHEDGQDFSEATSERPMLPQSFVDQVTDDQDTVPKVQFDELSSKYQRMEQDYRHLQEEVYILRQENQELKDKVGASRFGYNLLRINTRLFTFYTGIQSILVFDWIVSKVKGHIKKQGSVSYEDHILIVIMKLRLGFLTQDIAHRFSIPVCVASNIFRNTLPILSKSLQSLINWPSKESVRKNMPKSFKRKFRNCRCVIDCTEVFIERPANLTSRAQTWSNYKHHNTIKYLIGITPAGSISFLSAGWGGRVSDKEITIKSGFLDKLEHGDMVMADRGFLIADELAVHGATLTMPYFTKGKKQLSGIEVDKSRQLAYVRIHVERVIGRWKNYRILQSVVPITITDLMDHIVTVCACLTNLSRSVVPKK